MNHPTGSNESYTFSEPWPLRELKLRPKLTGTYLILVLLNLIVIGAIYQNSSWAIGQIQTTRNYRLPVALATDNGKTNLLRMRTAIYGYLSLEDPRFKDDFRQAQAAFEEDIRTLKALNIQATDPDEHNHMAVEMAKLEALYAEWQEMPEEVFGLHAAQLVENDLDRAAELKQLKTETSQLNEEMLLLLDDWASAQRQHLKEELAEGFAHIEQTLTRILINGTVTLTLGILFSFLARRYIVGPVTRLTTVAERIRGGDLDAAVVIETKDEIGTLGQTFNRMTSQLRQTLFQVRKEKERADKLLNVVIPIGVDLTTEKDFSRLLERILSEAKTFCHAGAGILYLWGKDDLLKLVIIRDNRHGIEWSGAVAGKEKENPYPPLPIYDDAANANRRNPAILAAVGGTTVNIPDASRALDYEFSGPDGAAGPYATSYLTIPLKNMKEQVLGVLQLLDAQEPESGQVIPFDQNLQQMMESYSSLAVAALEAYIREQSLRRELQQIKIDVDQSKKEAQVNEITESDFFHELQTKVKEIRSGSGRRRRDK
jgi:HAMP domain-containing protein